MATRACGRCGGVADLPQPSAWCGACWWEDGDVGDVLQLLKLDGGAPDMRRLMADLGMPVRARDPRRPDHERPRLITIPEASLVSWFRQRGEGFRLELIGMVVDEAPPDGAYPWPHWGFESGCTVQLYRQLVMVRGSSVFGEIRWRPEHEPEASIRSLVTVTPDKTDAEKVCDGLRLVADATAGLLEREAAQPSRRAAHPPARTRGGSGGVPPPTALLSARR